MLVGTWRWEPLDSTLDSILTLLTLATLLDGTGPALRKVIARSLLALAW